MEIERGTIKRKITTLEIKDFQIGNIFKDALLNQGYDLILEPIVNDMGVGIGETMVIYKVDKDTIYL